jgi:hypothetical protein
MDFIQKNKEAFPRDACVFLWLHKANEAKFPMETWFPKANGPKFFYTNTVSPCSPKFLKACSPKNFKPICKIPKENNGFQFPFSLENLTYFSRRRP